MLKSISNPKLARTYFSYAKSIQILKMPPGFMSISIFEITNILKCSSAAYTLFCRSDCLLAGTSAGTAFVPKLSGRYVAEAYSGNIKRQNATIISKTHNLVLK